MKTNELRKLVRQQLKEILILREAKLGPFYTQDPEDGYARPKLTNKADNAEVQGYVNTALGTDPNKRDARLRIGRTLSISEFVGIIKDLYEKRGEDTINLSTSTLEKWLNGHDILEDNIPLLFDFDTKRIKMVDLEKGQAEEKAKRAKKAAEKGVEAETGEEIPEEPVTEVTESTPLKEILGEFKLGALDINVDDIINMFVTKFKDDPTIRNDFRTGKITPQQFALELKTEFGIREEISNEIYEELLNISKRI